MSDHKTDRFNKSTGFGKMDSLYCILSHYFFYHNPAHPQVLIVQAKGQMPMREKGGGNGKGECAGL